MIDEYQGINNWLINKFIRHSIQLYPANCEKYLLRAISLKMSNSAHVRSFPLWPTSFQVEYRNTFCQIITDFSQNISEIIFLTYIKTGIIGDGLRYDKLICLSLFKRTVEFVGSEASIAGVFIDSNVRHFYLEEAARPQSPIEFDVIRILIGYEFQGHIDLLTCSKVAWTFGTRVYS